MLMVGRVLFVCFVRTSLRRGLLLSMVHESGIEYLDFDLMPSF